VTLTLDRVEVTLRISGRGLPTQQIRRNPKLFVDAQTDGWTMDTTSNSRSIRSLKVKNNNFLPSKFSNFSRWSYDKKTIQENECNIQTLCPSVEMSTVWLLRPRVDTSTKRHHI